MNGREEFPLTELMLEPPVRLPVVRPAASSLRDSLTMFFYDRRRILAVLFVGLLLTAGASFMAPKKYSAEADLLLRLGREYIYKAPGQHGDFDLLSLGKDGQPGGDGDNADQVSW